jgi:hypothetical protein
MTVTDVIRMFAKFGFTDTPLTCAQIEDCIRMGFDEDMIYGLGCDLAAGWRYNEVIDAYYWDILEKDLFA